MNSGMKEGHWHALSEAAVRRRWAELSRKERAEAWKYASHMEKEAIANATNASLNELAARARKLPKEKSSTGSEKDEVQPDDERKLVKFELERIHRERVETELEALREHFSSYADLKEKRSRKRRSENIYILVALGIIGGYLSYNPNLVLDTVYQLIGLAFIVASGTFILVKVITVRAADIDQESGWNKFDNIVDASFAAIISGVFVFGSLAALFSIYNIETSFLLEIATLTITSAVTIVQAWAMYGRYNNRHTKSPNEIHDELVEKLFRLPDADDIDESTSELTELVKEFVDSGAIVSKIEDIREKCGKIDGIPKENKDKIQSSIDDIIEEKEKREKSDEELRAEKVSELEQQRRQHREEMRKET